MVLFGCAPDYEANIKYSNKNHMTEFQAALSDNKIPFRMDDTGSIRYPKEYGEKVGIISNKLDKEISRKIGTMCNMFLSESKMCITTNKDNHE